MSFTLRANLAKAGMLSICLSLVFVAMATAQRVSDIHLFKKGGDQVDWCRSSNRIVYASRGPDSNYGIHTCLPNGEDDVWITKDNPHVPPGQKGTPCWQPSGKWILFVAEKAKHPGSSFWSTPGIGNNSDLWLMTADGQNAWPLTDLPISGDKGLIIPKFSHDGKKIVWADRVEKARVAVPRQFCAYWDLKVADLEFINGVPKLTNIKTFRPGGNKAFNESYGFTPDDKSIIFCSDYNQPSFWQSQIFTCDASTGGNITQLTNGSYNEHACYSPDGKSIVWMTAEGEWRGTDWWIMNVDGSNKHQLTFFNKRGHKEYSPTRKTCCLGVFSPDGKQFLGGIQNSIIKQTGDSYMLTFGGDQKPVAQIK